MIDKIKMFFGAIIGFIGFFLITYIKLLKKEKDEISAKNELLNKENETLKQYKDDSNKKDEFESDLYNGIDKIDYNYNKKEEEIEKNIHTKKDGKRYKVKI